MELLCSFQNRQPLLDVPDAETLGILAVNCNTIEAKEADDPEKCKTNTRQETDATEKHYTNTDGSKFEIEGKPMVNDTDNNNIKYFIPDPHSNTDKKASSRYIEWYQVL